MLMFELFSVRKWSPYQIARHFNELKVDGWDGWTESGIKKLLVGLDAMGIFIWNRTHREYDVEEDKIVVVPNPRSEWEIYIDPKLRLVPVEWWIDARRRLRNVWDRRRSDRPKASRNQISATTLFSGTVVCEYCGGRDQVDPLHGKVQADGMPQRHATRPRLQAEQFEERAGHRGLLARLHPGKSLHRTRGPGLDQEGQRLLRAGGPQAAGRYGDR